MSSAVSRAPTWGEFAAIPGGSSFSHSAEAGLSFHSQHTGDEESLMTSIDASALGGISLEDARARSQATGPLYAVLFASLGIVVGLIWDISWHRTIGRDTFWSPPHLLEQLGGARRRLELRMARAHDHVPRARRPTTRAPVRFWGFRGAARRVGLHLGHARDDHVGARSTTGGTTPTGST